MLINLSNHRLETWSDEQIRQAELLYGKIYDMPFPAVNPDADEDEITKLAEEFCKICMEKLKFVNLKDNAVHIMGEFTFTYAVVNLLKQNGIKCVASTTKRLSIENTDGSKTTKFDFIKFREYK